MSTDAETTSATETPTTPTKAGSAPGSAASTPSKETDEARTQLTQGRRHLLVKDYFSAAAALAKGCELLAERFGDMAPELGDAYLTYGRALLELARSESGVLGVNEEDNAEAEDDEEEDGGDEEEGEGEEEGAEENGKDGGEKDAEENGKDGVKEEDDKDGAKKDAEVVVEDKKDAAEAKEGAVDKKDTEDKAEVKEDGHATSNGAASSSNGTASNGVKENGKADETIKEEEDGDEEDVNNLQLAWEILELAKRIFEKQMESEGESNERQNALKLSEVYLKLGEVGVESENYSTAVEDMKKCLELQRRFLDEDDRRIAETLYNMGAAYSHNNEFDAAIDQFKLAGEQIEKRIANLEKKSKEPAPAAEEKGASDDPFYTVQGEIDELKALLPEIKEKVTDMLDFKKETVRRMMEGLAEASAKQSSTADGAGPSSSSASDKPVSSVAHLVKRKPKEEVKADQADQVEKMETDVAVSKEEEKEDDSLDRKRKQDGDEAEATAKKAKVDDSEEIKPSE